MEKTMNARKLAAALASSAFFIALPLAHAQSVDADVSIGGGSGLSADVTTGGGTAANADVSLGTNGIGLTDDVDAGATASIGGTGGTAAGLSVGTGSGTSAGVGIGLGTGTAGTAPGTGTAGGGTTGGGTGTGGTGTGTFDPAGMVAGMSESQLQSYRRTCADVTAQRAGFDKNLIALCEMIQSASR
jgi:hypothetical protein